MRRLGVSNSLLSILAGLDMRRSNLQKADPVQPANYNGLTNATSGHKNRKIVIGFKFYQFKFKFQNLNQSL